MSSLLYTHSHADTHIATNLDCVDGPQRYTHTQQPRPHRCVCTSTYKLPTFVYSKDACLSTGPTFPKISAGSCPQHPVSDFLVNFRSCPAWRQESCRSREAWGVPCHCPRVAKWKKDEGEKEGGGGSWDHWNNCHMSKLQFPSYFLYLGENMSSYKSGRKKKPTSLAYIFPWRTWQCLNIRTASKSRVSKTHSISRSSWNFTSNPAMSIKS